MKKNTVKVTAATGRVCPIHPSIAAGVGGRQLRITDADTVELPNNVSVRRRIARGDLVVVTEKKAASAVATKIKEG